MKSISRRAWMLSAGAGALSALAGLPGPLVTAQAKGLKPARGTYHLPPLPPPPPLPARRPEASVQMDPASAWTETKLDFPIAEGPFADSWESLDQTYPATDIAWLREAKFGIWVHFGPQASGRSGDWYAKRLYDETDRWSPAYANHLKDYGHPSQVGYKEVLRDWNPRKLDPARLTALYKAAGARFLLVQGVHHDNFDNWNSKYQKWNSTNLGPRRDIVGEWAKAARSQGLRYGVTFHHEYTWWWWQTAFGADTKGPLAGVPYDGALSAEDGKGKWWEGYDPRMLYTVNLREYQGLDTRWAPPGGIFQNHQDYARWYATWWAYRIFDVIESYDPDFIYTDGDSTHPFTGERSGTGAKTNAAARVLAHYFNRTLQRRGKLDTFGIIKFRPPTKGVVSTAEGGFPDDIKRDQPWLGETPIGDWFYAPGFEYNPRSVIHYILENAARDGATAVSIPILPDGSLDPRCETMLQQVGQWMAVNGEGIYGSRAWRQLGEGERINGKLKTAAKGNLGAKQSAVVFDARDFRFTLGRRGDLYAFCMTVPLPETELKITALSAASPERVAGVKLLGWPGEIDWRQEPDGLVVRLPKGHQAAIALGLRIALT